MTDRLSEATQDRLPSEVARFGYDRAALRLGAVHLGVGAFHRAHQAVYLDEANAASAEPWGTIGMSLRSPTAAEQLAAQDGLFTVATRDGAGERYRLVGSLARVLTVPDAPEEALAALSDRGVSVVTLTITEKGYATDPATGDLLADSPDIAADLAAPRQPKSALGTLAEALRRRRDEGAGPLSLVSCDNLPDNGERLRTALIAFGDRVDPTLARWIEAECAFPGTMVDRIVPATTPADRARAERALGLTDEGHVVAEPFTQWVIQDRFCGPRPAWEAGGAKFTDDVRPYEKAKLRLLNGPHSAIAYLGCLGGAAHVHEFVGDASARSFIQSLMAEEIAPTLTPPRDLNLDGYIRSLLGRFENPALQHKTRQIASDGSQKIPQRLLDTIRDRLAAGAPHGRLVAAVAAWIRFASVETKRGGAEALNDPRADAIAKAANAAGGEPDALVEAFLAMTDVFGRDLPGHDGFRSSLIEALRVLSDEGVGALMSKAGSAS